MIYHRFSGDWGYSRTSKSIGWSPVCPACHFCLQIKYKTKRTVQIFVLFPDLASCIPFAVAVIMVKSLLSISSIKLSSCLRCVDFSVSLFGKKIDIKFLLRYSLQKRTQKARNKFALHSMIFIRR